MDKIIITTPLYRSEAAIVPECRATVHSLRDAGMCVAPEWVIKPGPLVYKNRNDAIRFALKIPGWTYMLCLDADISLPHPVADVEHLLAHGKDIIGGAYVMRYEDGPDMICAARLGSGHVTLTSTGLHEVDWTGGGCMLITRECIEALGPLWFQHITLADGSDQTAEDVGFCQHARAHGYTIWLDCDIRAVHHQLNNRGSGTMADYDYTVTKDENVKMLQERVDGCTRGIFGLTLDIKAAQIAMNVKALEKLEKSLADTMKQKAAYQQMLSELLK